ncbi:hypothetical protein GGI00_001615, partial [Coemansia sp. RSA 2681]
AAQPALLYLSPACILAVVVTAAARGELAAVFSYSEETKKDEDDKADKDKKQEDEGEEKAPAVHRYNLRNQSAAAPGLMTPASAGELADDEQENIKPPRVLDEKVNPIEEVEDNDSDVVAAPATPAKGKKGKKGGSKAKASKNPSGSRPSSVVTEPYLSNSFLSPTALSTATRSLCDGDVLDSSPIAASRLYRPSSSREAVAAFCLHSSPGDVIDGPLEIPLYAGLSSIGGTIGHRGTAAEDQRVCLPIAQAIDAVLEIDDGLHVLCDQGSVDGMYLGHRRARMKQGAGYVMSDGKLVWFGRFAFWYRVLDDTRRSASPPPPWRDTAGMRLFPSSEGKALAAADTMHSEPHAAPRSIVRESPAVAARPAMLSREARASRPRAARLQREVAAAAISQSPGLRLQRLPVLGSPPPSGPLSLLAHGSPGSDARSFLGSPPQGTDHGFALSPMLVNSPAYGSDGEESLPTGTEPMSEEDGDDEPPRHMLSSPPPLHLLTYPASPSPPRIHLGSAHSVLRLEGLRMGGGDVLASESDDDDDGRRSVLSRAQTEVLTASSCRSPEPEAVGVEAPPTQPVSPSRLPPQRLLTSGSRSSSVNDALLGKKHCAAAEQNTGGTQVTKAPVGSGESDASLAYLPQPSALVCAPSRVILVGNGASLSYTEHQQMIPRYPYDVKGMESFLRSATQNTSPTQPDIESIDGLDASHLSVISVETMQSSDFSQAFISPQPPSRPSAAIPCAVETRSSSRMSVDSADTSSLRNNCPALTTAQSSSVSSAMAPISTPTTRRLATYSKRHRRSIDNYTDEEEDDEQNEEEGEKDEEAPVVVSETPAKRTSNKLGSRSGSRLSTPSTSALSLASSSAAAGSRSSHRFSTPTSMSSRLKLPRHTPLNLKPSAHILHAPPPPPPPPPLRMNAMLSRTPMSRGSHGRSPATTQSSNYPNLPPTAPLTASARSAGFDVSRLSIGRTPMGTSNDGFPDDDMIPGSLLGTQSVNRANRSHRRYTQGSGMPPAPVNQAHSPLIYPHTTSAVAPVQTYRPVMTGVLESPMSIDSPTAAYTRPPAPSERIIGDTVAMGDEDGLALSSSPSLPHPSMLLQSPSTAVNADSETQEKTNASKEPVEHRPDLVPTRSGAEEEALFDPLVDPLSSVPTASAKSTTGSPVTDDRDPFAEPVDIDDTQLDHEDSIVPEKPPPRIHLRVPAKSTTSLVSCSSAAAAVAASATDVLAEDSPTVAQQAASTGDGWINMDDVQIAADVPSKPARATTAVRHGRGAGRTRGRGAIKSDNDQPIAPRTPSATTISPAGSRSNTLLDSLRKLPGKQGSKRTGLSTSRRTPVSAKKTLPAPVVAKGTQSASGSPTPKALGIPVRASTATGTVAVAPKLQPVATNAAGGATLLQPERVDTKPGARVTGGKQRGGRRLSHRNLDLAQTTPTKTHHPSLPPTRKGIDRTPAA